MKLNRAVEKCKAATAFAKRAVVVGGIWMILGPPFIISIIRYHKNQERK